MVILAVLFIIWLASGFYCGVVADAKGYDWTAWGLGGLFFGLIALIAVAGLPDKKLRKYIDKLAKNKML